MTLYIFNTLSRQKEPFIPLQKGRVLMYVCGPNLYGPCHVGHAMSYIVFDVIRRYLEYLGYSVRHVQNFTDLEDRIIETARESGIPIEDLADMYIARFLTEINRLNIKRAHEYPRATETIPTMIKVIRGLIKKGNAYPVDGDVYYRVTKNTDYGKLSRRRLDEMEAGARIDVDNRKEHPMDFALWKTAKSGEPKWKSPWGFGRPGWHIECTAMAIKFLGKQIDLHGGGQDVLFPHHENEIAQAESYTRKTPFVKYWVHNGLLRPGEGQEKMTRHLSNFVSLQDAIKKYSSDAIRLFILSSHYRTPLVWHDESLRSTERGLERLREAMNFPLSTSVEKEKIDASDLTQFAIECKDSFRNAMNDDFNTPIAISCLYELAREINNKKQKVHAAAIAPAQGILKELSSTLGLTLEEIQTKDNTEVSPFIEMLVTTRNNLRLAKQWELADQIRDQLVNLGVMLEDSSGETKWRLI